MADNNLINQVCAVCGKSASYTVLYPASFKLKQINEETFSARRIPDHCHYRLVRCKKCGLIYSNPILQKNTIFKLYKDSKLTYDNEIDDLSRTYGTYLRKVIATVPGKNSLLEIGCGNGFFLKEAKKQGFKNIWGVEPSVSAVNKAPGEIKKNIKIDIFRKGQFKKNSFDIVCFFQTLDHIIEPNEFLNSCKEVLKENGIIFCIVHNSNSFMARFMGEKTPIFDIEHTYLYNKNTLRKIFEKNNFTVVQELNIANEYSLKYWLSLLPLGNLKKIVNEFLAQLRIQDKKLRLMAGNIGIVAKKTKK